MRLGIFRRPFSRVVIDRLHGEIVAMVRQPALYRDFGVEDTFEGRFELLALFSTLVIRRLVLLGPPGPEIAQELTDALFSGLDATLREMGVGDLSVPRRMNRLAGALLGRRQAYEEGLADDDQAILSAAIARNVFGGAFEPGDPRVMRLLGYTGMLCSVLSQLKIENFTSDKLGLPAAELVGE